MNKIPRHWPLLAILSETGSLESYRRILYLTYFLSREAVLDYLFSPPPCLESPQVRADLSQLAAQGLVKMEFHNVWLLEPTRRGRNSFDKIRDGVPKKWMRSLKRLVKERGDLSYLQQLQDLLVSFPTPKNVSLRSGSLIQDASLLAKELEAFPPSHNLLLLQGSLDYVLCAEKKGRRIAQRKLLLAALSCYINQVLEVYLLTREYGGTLGQLDLRDLTEEFELLEKTCREILSLPRVEERHDLTLFAEV